MHHTFFIQSPVDGHVGCFHVLAIVTSAAVNIRAQVSFQIRDLSRYMPRSEVARACFLVFSLLRNLCGGFPGGSVLKNPPARWES